MLINGTTRKFGWLMNVTNISLAPTRRHQHHPHGTLPTPLRYGIPSPTVISTPVRWYKLRRNNTTGLRKIFLRDDIIQFVDIKMLLQDHCQPLWKTLFVCECIPRLLKARPCLVFFKYSQGCRYQQPTTVLYNTSIIQLVRVDQMVRASPWHPHLLDVPALPR